MNYQLFPTNKFRINLLEVLAFSNNERILSVIGAHPFYMMIDNQENKSYMKPEYWRIHTSFVQEGDLMDQYVHLFNLPLHHERKYR